MSFLRSIAIPSLLSGSAREVSPSVSRSEDAELFERFLAGDDAAAVTLFRKYNTRLFLYCAKVLGDSDGAEDITQGLWERVVALRSDPQPVRNPASFLFRIARNLCINQLKTRHRSVPLDTVSEADHPQVTIPGSSDMEELVLSSLDALRFEDRELLVLNVYCGYRFEEIAEMMDLSPNAVWTRASRARAQLRRIVGEMMERDETVGGTDTTEGAR